MLLKIKLDVGSLETTLKAFYIDATAGYLSSGEGTPQVTGWFEVTVAGKLVHSKKNGDGFVDNDAKLHKIITAIKAALA